MADTSTSLWSSPGQYNLSVTSTGVPTTYEMTRKRYLELTRIAAELCSFLESKGVEKREGCTMRRLAEELWNMPKDKK